MTQTLNTARMKLQRHQYKQGIRANCRWEKETGLLEKGKGNQNRKKKDEARAEKKRNNTISA